MCVMIHVCALNDGSIWSFFFVCLFFSVKVTHLIERIYFIELDQFSTAA